MSPRAYARPVGWEPRQKDLVLILARDMAARLATPIFVVDAVGTLVFFNEGAEALLGQSFADVGELPQERWSETFRSVDEDGNPIPRRQLPLGVALIEGRPAHRELDLVAADGVIRHLAVTAIPLQRHPGETVGAVAMFWERSPESGAAMATGSDSEGGAT
jgi:PAS domain-containing protein